MNALTASASAPESAPQHPVPPAPRVLVTGSRDWTGTEQIEQSLDVALALLQVPLATENTVTLVHGDAKGLDTLAAQVAAARGWMVESHPAQWNKHTEACPAGHVTPVPQPTCKMAGHRRNHEMIALGADLVIAFPTGDEASGLSRDTWGCARAATNAQLPTVILWKESLHPWGPKALRLVLAERVSAFADPALHTADPVRLGTLAPLPF
jgi:hypothetical protein